MYKKAGSLIIAGILCCALFHSCKHKPSVWEVSVQKIAHNGDTTGVLFEAMRQYDSIIVAQKMNVYSDSTMDKFQKFWSNYLSKATPKEKAIAGQETQRWEDGQYSFAWDYYGTSANTLLVPENEDKIYSIPISWWKRPLAPSRK